MQQGGDFGVREAFDFVEQENLPLTTGQASQRAFEREAQRGMRPRSAVLEYRLARSGLRLLHFPAAHTAAAHVVAGIDQDAKNPSGKGRFAGVTADGALHFQESFLDGVFGVGAAPEEIPREAFHAPAVKLVETFERAQVAAAPVSPERPVLTLRIAADAR